MNIMKNQLSFSTSPLTRITNSKYFDLDKTLDVMSKLWNFSIIQGFEFQHLAEWNSRHPPQNDDPRYSRLSNWNDSIKYNIKEICTKLNELSIPILSIHGNRDIGALLCSDNREEINNGRELIKDSANLAELININLCVFHIWDTKNEDLNIPYLKETIHTISAEFPKMVLSVENIPTSMSNFTPFELIKDFNWITLDLRWCALYDELKQFSKIKNKIVNVHVRGSLEGDRWQLNNAPFTLEEALDVILKEWNYKGILTFEPEGGLSGASWEDLTKAINNIKYFYQ
jgi:sugar phosphate isomerase/epimerase